MSEGSDTVAVSQSISASCCLPISTRNGRPLCLTVAIRRGSNGGRYRIACGRAIGDSRAVQQGAIEPPDEVVVDSDKSSESGVGIRPGSRRHEISQGPPTYCRRSTCPEYVAGSCGVYGHHLGVRDIDRTQNLAIWLEQCKMIVVESDDDGVIPVCVDRNRPHAPDGHDMLHRRPCS